MINRNTPAMFPSLPAWSLTCVQWPGTQISGREGHTPGQGPVRSSLPHSTCPSPHGEDLQGVQPSLDKESVPVN